VEVEAPPEAIFTIVHEITLGDPSTALDEHSLRSGRTLAMMVEE
jgi:hypothetical protein